MGVLDFFRDDKRSDFTKAIKQVGLWSKVLRQNPRTNLFEKDHEMSKIHIVIGAGPLNLEKYITKKSNQNLLIAGAPGQGKSKLMRLALKTMPNPKVIFNFKEGDEYLKMEGNVIHAEQSLPDPFADSDAFTNAIAVAFNVTSEGIQASIAMSLARRLAQSSKSWADFAKNAKKASIARDSNTKAAANYLIEKMGSLTYKAKPIELNLDSTTILDLSRMNEEAKLFYAELFLRQIYKMVRNRDRNTQKVIICVDEAHRLTKNVYGKYQSVLNELSREIRAFGMLWTATQNLSDMPGPIRSTFETQFCFNTTNEDDMHALAAVDKDLAKVVSSLKNHQFVDAKRNDVHDKIPIFRADVSGLVDRELPATSPARDTEEIEALAEVQDRPTATQFAALEVIYENKGGRLAELVKHMKKAGYVTSDPTLYGAKGRKGIFEVVTSLGLARKRGLGYELTEKGLRWLDADKLMENGKNLGSDLHRQLMKKTINYLHKRNILVIVPEEENAPDLMAYPVDKKKKYLWDDKNKRAYEIETTARADNIIKNMERNRRAELLVTWINYDKDMLEEIKKITENRDGYLLIKI